MIERGMQKHQWPEYTGSLNKRRVEKNIRNALNSWSTQIQKCRNPRNKYFKYCGAKGIDVHYSSREFVGWWLWSLSKKEWKIPTCGRVDHSKGYSFDNIEMQEKSDNSKERIRRCGIVKSSAIRRPIGVTVFKNDIFFGSFGSFVDASLATGVAVSNIARICKRQTIRRDGFRFRFSQGSENDSSRN